MKYDNYIKPLFLAGCLLRLMLFISTDYNTAYDDHKEPIRYILEHKAIPPAESSWEAFQPPLYYIISAIVFSVTDPVTGSGWKFVQMISFFAGILTLYFCYRITQQAFPKDSIIQVYSLGFLVFLPRHIYMSAMLTNDSLLYFVMALAIYSLIRCMESQFAPKRLLTLILSCGLCGLTKASGLAILPIVTISSGIALIKNKRLSQPVKAAIIISVFALSAAISSVKYIDSFRRYGNPFVYNIHFFDNGFGLPPGSLDKISFSSFRIAELIKKPVIDKSHLDSFFTELYARMWFDYEGVFIDTQNPHAWRPGQPIVILALLPSIILVYGLGVAIKNIPRGDYYFLFVMLFCAGLSIPLLMTFIEPNFSVMKAAFMLIGIPALGALFGLGMRNIAGNKTLIRAAFVNCALLAVCITAHFCRLAYISVL